MLLRMFCLLLACSLASARHYGFVEDRNGAIDFSATKSDQGSLKLHCTYEQSKTESRRFFHMAIVEGFEYGAHIISQIGELSVYGQAINYLGDDTVEVDGNLNQKKTSYLDVTWRRKDEGYNKRYLCYAAGFDSASDMRIYYRAVTV